MSTRPFKVDPTKIFACDPDIIYIIIHPKDGQEEIYETLYLYEESKSLQELQQYVQEKYLSAKVISIIIDGPTQGYIYTWNNYADQSWYETGETCGYA